jgi:hypothetical protein
MPAGQAHGQNCGHPTNTQGEASAKVGASISLHLESQQRNRQKCQNGVEYQMPFLEEL